MFDQAKELQAIFIRHARLVCGETPTRAELFIFIKPEGQVGIADINREKHMMTILPLMLFQRL